MSFVRFMAIALVTALLPLSSQAQQNAVERSGQKSAVKLEQVIAGHLKELNGKYKLRVSELTFDPGGSLGPHHHAGPGIRCVTAGELTYERQGRTTVYKAGECFFEAGDLSHTGHNRTNAPLVILSFEILPATWSGSSTIPVPSPAPETPRAGR